MADDDYILMGLLLGIAFTIVAVFGLILATNMIPLDAYGKYILCNYFTEHKNILSDKNFIENMTRYRCLR